MLRRPILWWLRSALKVGLVAGLASIDVRYVPALLEIRRWFLPFGHPAAPGYIRGWLVWASHRSGPEVLAAWHSAWGPHPNLLVAVLQIPVLYVAVRILFWRRRRRDEVRAASAATHGSARWRKPGELGRTLQTVDTEQP
jgi:hypothetical protein